MAEGRIIVETKDGVGRIVLDNQERLNAISFDMWQAATAALKGFASDPKVRVVVVTGAGEKAFAAGADISKFENERGSKAAVDRYNQAVSDAYSALLELPKPSIARLRGYTIGGGLAFALCADIRIAAEDVTVAIPAAKLGLGYGYDGIKHLVDLVGPSNAMEIFFTAKRFTAIEAQTMGLINRVVPIDRLDAVVDDYTATIAGNAPLTIASVKRIIKETVKEPAGRDHDLCERLVQECYASADYQEGRLAFMEKRKPRFQGR